MAEPVIDCALEQIRQLQPYTPGKPVEELQRELGITHAIKLASNESPLGYSSRARDAILDACTGIEFYPDANAYYLKRKLAKKLGVEPTQITVGNGSNDVLDLIARTWLDYRGEAVFSKYAFLVYSLVVQACGAKACIAESNAHYGHELSAMLDLITDKTRLIFIANPNNPTGSWLKASALKAFIEQVPDHIVIVIDEAYFEYVNEVDYSSALVWLDDYPNLMVTRTFSKIYGLAGLRIGYAVSSAAICDLLNRVRQPFNSNSLALAAALASLDDEAFVESSRRHNLKGIRQLREYFDSRAVDYIPSVANFLTAGFGERSDDIYQKLLRQGIIVRSLANYQMPHYLRISIGTEQQNNRLLQQLDAIL